ncbi:FkbM family methyltransferase [uncultured Selenomonas sp.]|uniref:FkbM family methyltransferase n=1 Tax=uncultured Selenomonas sp. TaxID=159275 RepID=UPI0025E222B0|nr:FkbM family methyltransferase [uncultured Selenomonas sp.]
MRGGSYTTFVNPVNLKELSWDKVIVLPSGRAKWEIARQLRSLGVPPEKIVLYFPEAARAWPSYEVRVTDAGFSARFGDVVFDALHTSDAIILEDIFVSLEYALATPARSMMVVDIGMNVGLASLFFAAQANVSAVYGFEPFAPTYEAALHNFRQNPAWIQSKLHPQCLGLSNREATMRLPYSVDFPGGMSVYAPQREDGVEIHLADAAEVLAPLLAQEDHDKVLLKIDVEGSEYDILDSLSGAGLLEQVDYIVMETHCGKEALAKDVLAAHGFAFFSHQGASGLGMIKAVRVA